MSTVDFSGKTVFVGDFLLDDNGRVFCLTDHIMRGFYHALPILPFRSNKEVTLRVYYCFRIVEKDYLGKSLRQMREEYERRFKENGSPERIHDRVKERKLTFQELMREHRLKS